MKNNTIFLILIIVLLILSIPFIGTQISDEVNWNIMDYVVAGMLLFTTGIALEIIIRKVKPFSKRLMSIIILLLILILIWAELAVGIFGSPIAGS